jgi:dihydroorotate dehydrogenase (fumarate)
MKGEQFSGDVTALPQLLPGRPCTGPANVVQSASALLRHGPEYAGVPLQELHDWMSRKGFQALAEVRGLLAAPDAEGRAAQERADYVCAVREASSGACGTY